MDRRPKAYVVYRALLHQLLQMLPTQDRSARSDVKRATILYVELLRDANSLVMYADKYPHILPPNFAAEPLNVDLPPLPPAYDPQYDDDAPDVPSGAVDAHPPPDAPIDFEPAISPTPPCAQPKRTSPAPAPATPTISVAAAATRAVAAPGRVGTKAQNAVAGPSNARPVRQMQVASAASIRTTRATCEYAVRDPFESVANRLEPLAKRNRGNSDADPIDEQTNSVAHVPKKKKRAAGGNSDEEVEIDNPGMMG